MGQILFGWIEFLKFLKIITFYLTTLRINQRDNKSQTEPY